MDRRLNAIAAILVLVVLVQGRLTRAADQLPAGFACDGALLNESFDAGKLPPGWELGPAPARRDVSFKDGRCILNPGRGDNFISMPSLAINLEEVFVVELTFSIPAPTTGGYSLLTLSREGGEFKVLLSPGEKGQYVVMTRSRPLGLIEPGKSYTVSVRCHPDGNYEGTLVGEGIKQPVTVKVAGPDGPFKTNLIVGNGINEAEGGVAIDHAKVGLPAAK